MAKHYIHIGNERREMTEQEIADLVMASREINELKKLNDERLDAAESGRSKLAALGLTEEEITALLG